MQCFTFHDYEKLHNQFHNFTFFHNGTCDRVGVLRRSRIWIIIKMKNKKQTQKFYNCVWTIDGVQLYTVNTRVFVHV